MHSIEPTIVIDSSDPTAYSRQTSVKWTAGFGISGDNPVAHGGGGTGPDGFDLVAAALGQCLLNTLIADAERKRIPLRSARALVATKSRIPGRGQAPYISDFKVDIYIEGDLDEGQRAELEQATTALCGVRETLMRTPRIAEHVHIGAGPELGPARD